MIFHCDDGYKAEILEMIQNGRMTLFLGAGFSYSAKDRTGAPVPMAGQISNKLAEFAGLKVTTGRPLSRVYDAAVAATNKFEVNEFLRIQYSGCQATWQKVIPKILWKRIYTTNIDDVLNSALTKCSAPAQGFSFRNYKDSFDSPSNIDDTQVINLHGSVRKARAGFVFGGKEYASAVKENLSWHIKFSEDFYHGGMVFIGSQILEPDLELYILYRSDMGFGSKIQKFDSFLVLPDVDDVLTNSMSALGIACIEATGEEFLDWVDKNIEKVKRSVVISKQLPEISKSKSESSVKAYIKFRNQFHQLTSDEEFARPDLELHDFFSGDAPDWWDITQRNDAILSSVSILLHDLTSSGGTVLGLRGSAGCGKSTSLMRVAYELFEKGWQVYYFEDESQIDIDSATKVLKTTNGNSTLVVIDNAADHVEQINKLIERLGLLAVDNKLNIKFLIAERENRLLRVYSGLKSVTPDMKEVDVLNDEDIDAIINKLTEKDKLKELRGKTEEEQKQFFKKRGDNQLLVAMRELTYGGRFDDIIANEYLSLKTTKARRLYAVVALCHSQRHSISPDVLYRALMDEVARPEIDNMIREGDLRKVVIKNKDGNLSTRHVSIAQHLLKSSKISKYLTRKQKADLLTRIMKALAPVVSITELIKGTSESLLVRAFMDYDHIENVFGDDNSAIDQFFVELKPLYEWNSKYWAQRGLFESDRNNFSDALDFVGFAVNKDGHWTIRNASALVYLRASCASSKYDYARACELCDDGLTMLEGVIVETGYKDRKSIYTLFDKLSDFIVAWKDIDKSRHFDQFERYYKEARANWNIPSEYYDAITKTRKNLLKKVLGLTKP